MSYSKFLVKSTYKDPVTGLITLIVLLISLSCLGFNFQNRQRDTLRSNVQHQLTFQTKQLKSMQQSANSTIQAQQTDIKTNQRIITLLNQHKWASAYHLRIKQNQRLIQNDQQVSGNHDSTLRAGLIQENNWYTALAKLNVPEVSATYPTTGIGFTLWLATWIAPILITSMIILICAQLATKPYNAGVDQSSLLPISRAMLTSQTFFSSWLVALISAGVVFGLSLITATIISGVGSVAYPWEMHHHGITYHQQGSGIGPIVLLEVLSIGFIVAIVNLVAKGLRKPLPTVFVSLLLLPGINVLTTLLAPLAPIANWLPMTYFSVTDIVSGKMAVTLTNTAISWQHGCWVLLIGTLILLTLLYGATFIAGSRLFHTKQKVS